MGIERGREMGVERETNQKKKRAQRERESAYCMQAVEKNNKKIGKEEYFIEILCNIDKLM